MSFKALIVDDEYPARQELRYLLGQMGNVEVVGEAESASEAFKLIQALEYDILFLDVNLPGINGLELSKKVQSLARSPYVIFITAYENFALDAFEVNALDYILKPIDKVRLKKAVDKVPLKKGGDSEDVDSSPEMVLERIAVEKGDRIVLVDVNDVYYAYTEAEKVFVKTHSEKMPVRYTLKELEQRLNKNCFLRTHRSYLVNIHKVREIMPYFNGAYLLKMHDRENSEVPVSRAQAKNLRKLLGR